MLTEQNNAANIKIFRTLLYLTESIKGVLSAAEVRKLSPRRVSIDIRLISQCPGSGVLKIYFH